jgi:hypothetical protein
VVPIEVVKKDDGDAEDFHASTAEVRLEPQGDLMLEFLTERTDYPVDEYYEADTGQKRTKAPEDEEFYESTHVVQRPQANVWMSAESAYRVAVKMISSTMEVDQEKVQNNLSELAEETEPENE